MRACKGCGEDRPLERFPLYSVDGRQYRRHRCHRCYNEHRNATKTAGVCSQCGETRAAREFPGYGSRICFPCRRVLGRARPCGERQGEKRRATERAGVPYQTIDERSVATAARKAKRVEERTIRVATQTQRWTLSVYYPGMSPKAAHNKVYNAIRGGYLVKPQSCVSCGAEPVPRHSGSS